MLKAVISGSFDKYKDEIDALHDEFADNGVEVIAPDKGWLSVVRSRLWTPGSFRPLPSERHMPSIKAIEDDFFAKIRQSDFLYVYNRDQYIGVSAAAEMGAALGGENPIPVFTKEFFDPDPIEFGLAWRQELLETVHMATVAEAARRVREMLGQTE